MNDLNRMTVPELDEILDELDLDKTGLKPDKVSRIENYLASDTEAPTVDIYAMNGGDIFYSDNDTETPMAGAETPEVTNRREVIESLRPFTISMWSGVKPVYVCTECGRQEDDEDDAIMHFLTHFPYDERETILNDLVKDK